MYPKMRTLSMIFKINSSTKQITLAIIIISAIIGYASVKIVTNITDRNNRLSHMNFISFTHKINNQTINGATTGKKCNPALLFIHGAPGDWKSWARYMGDTELLDKFFMIAVDRPGYGQSDFGIPVTNIKNQAQFIIDAALKEHKGPFILIGHSYGGPIQIQLGIDFPDQIASKIILAGALSPALHQKRFYHILGDLFFIRPMLPTAIKVTNLEMLSLQSQLQDQAQKLSSITSPVTIIQGGKDWLVPKGNANYAKEQLKSVKKLKTIELKKQGHFIPWEQYDLVKKQILNFATNSQCET